MAAPRQGEPRAWGWVQHLVDGGSTPWSDWSGDAPPCRESIPPAQNLELLRRLNELGPPGPELSGRVLAVSAPGRGQPELELRGADRGSPFGPRPVDPSTIPFSELLRVATAVLAGDLIELGPPPPSPAPVRRPRLFRTRYRLVGDPELVAPIRGELKRQGRPPAGRSPRTIVLAAGVDRMLADAWTHRAFGPGVLPWPAWLGRLARESHLPDAVDVLGQVRRAARRVGTGRVHVVLDPSHLAGLVGARGPLELPPAPPASGPDLARRVAPVLAMSVPGRRRALLRRLRLLTADSPGHPPRLPPEQLEWANARADQTISGLRRGGYAVHGDLETLRPHSTAQVAEPDPSATLLLALGLLLRLAGPPGPPGEPSRTFGATEEEDA